MPKSILKNDRYKKTRGGYSRVLEVSCQMCGSFVCLYQKDGIGHLRRLYIDRIIKPTVSIDGKRLICPNAHVLGIRIIYKNEQRPAFRLFVDSVTKKIIKPTTTIGH